MALLILYVSSIELLDYVDEVACCEFSRMRLLHLREYALEELLERIVCVLGAGDNLG